MSVRSGSKGKFCDCFINMIACVFGSYHPYLFFNNDGITVTFVGFNVNNKCDLINPVQDIVMEKAVMSQQLYQGLQRNGVNLSEKYQSWNKEAMVAKIGMVMGLQLEHIHDPDKSYVLTVDNVIKMLAIIMRFR